MIQSLTQLLSRDLDKLKTELELYSNESDMWQVKDGIGNSAGNLALHLCGNLNHFIGAILGNTGYVRDRPAEFSGKNIPLKNIIEEIENTKEVITATLTGIATEELQNTYPIEVMGKPMTTQYFLLHLLAHLNYHLGQVNYHRRLIG